MTYALREARAYAIPPLAAQIARLMALTAPFAVGFPGHPFHEPFHARGVLSPLCVKVSPVGTFHLRLLRPGWADLGSAFLLMHWRSQRHTLQGGSTARPWTGTWMGVINLETEVSRQAVYDDHLQLVGE